MGDEDGMQRTVLEGPESIGGVGMSQAIYDMRIYGLDPRLCLR